LVILCSKESTTPPSFREPGALEQTYAIFSNVLEFDESGHVLNAKHAEKRAAQYIFLSDQAKPANKDHLKTGQ